MKHLPTCPCLDCLNDFEGEYEHEPHCDCAVCESKAESMRDDYIDAIVKGN